jgi:hypothetical protein
VIDAYVDSLLGALQHDRSLARRLRREVEDHLWAAVAADPSEEIHEAQRRAIAGFGEPRLIAAQFAAVSLQKQTRRTGVAVVLIVAGVYLTMKARVAWYALMECAIANDITAVTQLVGSIDRYSFWLSVVIGVGCWAYSGRGHFQVSLSEKHRGVFRRFMFLCTAAAIALVVSVISDAVLTLLRPPKLHLSLEFLIPTLSMLCEILGAGLLVCQIRTTARRAAITRSMLEAV